MLNVNLNGNSSGFTQMLNQAKTQAKAFSNSVSHEVSSSWGSLGKTFAGGIAGMFTVEGILKAVEIVTGKVTELRELSEQLGTDDVEKIQRWGKAFEKVGGSVSKLTTLTGQMTEKRNASMGHDVSAIRTREELEGMGFSPGEINPSTGMNSLDFMQKAFHFANQSGENRNYFEDVFGAKSARFAGSEKYFGGASAPMQQAEYEKLKETAQALDEFKEALKNSTFAVVRFLMAGATLNDEMQKRIEEQRERFGKEREDMNTVREKILSGKATQADKDWMVREIAKQQKQGIGVHFTDALRRAIQDSPTAQPQQPQKENRAGTVYGPYIDPDLRARREEQMKEESDARLSLNASGRGLLTIGDRRASIAADIATVDKQIAGLNAKLNDPTHGLSKEAYDKMTQVDKDELTHKLTMELMGEQSKKNSLTTDLREKPLSFSADTLAKAGLYSASALQFNPVLGIAQRQLTALQQIVHNTTPKPSLLTDKNSIRGDRFR